MSGPGGVKPPLPPLPPSPGASLSSAGRLERGPRLLEEGPNIETRQEITRSRLAIGLTGLLAAVALSLIGLTASDALGGSTTKDLVAGIFSPLVALTGTALGFYFGGHRGSK